MKKNEVICYHIWHQKLSGGIRLVRIFPKNEFWKFIGCIILAFIPRKKGCKIWAVHASKDLGKAEDEIDRDVRGNSRYDVPFLESH